MLKHLLMVHNEVTKNTVSHSAVVFLTEEIKTQTH